MSAAFCTVCDWRDFVANDEVDAIGGAPSIDGGPPFAALARGSG